MPARSAAVTLNGEHSLEFFNGQVVFRSQNGSGNHYKFMSPAAVAAAFRNMPIDSGWLPPGVVRCGATPNGQFALLFIPAGVHRIEVERGARMQTLRVPLPSLVFFGLGKFFSLWATKTAALSPKAPLFHAPLPNVFENGSICWGTNKPPRCSPAAIGAAWDLFITSPFTGHAAEGKSRAHNADVRGLLRKLASKKKFPLRELISYSLSLERTVERLIGGDAIGN